MQITNSEIRGIILLVTGDFICGFIVSRRGKKNKWDLNEIILKSMALGGIVATIVFYLLSVIGALLYRDFSIARSLLEGSQH